MIPVFPRLNLLMEPVDAAAAPDSSREFAPPAQGNLRAFRLQLETQVAVARIDTHGRVVALIYPSTKLEVVREEGEFARSIELVRAATSRRWTGELSAGPDTAAIPGTRAEEVAIRVGRIILAGTLLIPKLPRPVPAVVLISGSGPQDRDGRLTLPGLEGYRPLRDIAHVLAARGVAVLRLDDRGVGGSGADTSGPVPTTWTMAADVQAAIAALRSRTDIDPRRIGLLGHSEGALIAMMVAADDPKLAGIVLLAAPAARGDTILRDQLEEALASMPEMSAASKDSARVAQQQLFASLRGDSAPAQAAEWLRAYIALKPAVFATRVRSPVLVLHGARDRQVPSSHAQSLAEFFRARAGADVTAVVLDGLNHLLLPASTGSVAEDPSLSVQKLSPELLTLIGEWFRKRLEPRSSAGPGDRASP